MNQGEWGESNQDGGAVDIRQQVETFLFLKKNKSNETLFEI